MEEYKKLRKQIITLLYPNIPYSDSSLLKDQNQCKSLSLQPTFRSSTPPKRVNPLNNIDNKIEHLNTTVRDKHSDDLVDPVISYLQKYKTINTQS